MRLTSSPRTVENACGVTHGTSYFHFDTKENYLRIVLKRISDFLATDFVASDGSLSENQMAMLGYQGYNSVSFILIPARHSHQQPDQKSLTYQGLYGKPDRSDRADSACLKPCSDPSRQLHSV